MLSIKNLHVSIKKTKILQGMNLNIKNGELHVIMGPNGSGKSTLANVLAGKQEYNIENVFIQVKFYKSSISVFFLARVFTEGLGSGATRTVCDEIVTLISSYKVFFGVGKDTKSVPKASTNSSVEESVTVVNLNRLFLLEKL